MVGRIYIISLGFKGLTRCLLRGSWLQIWNTNPVRRQVKHWKGITSDVLHQSEIFWGSVWQYCTCHNEFTQIQIASVQGGLDLWILFLLVAMSSHPRGLIHKLWPTDSLGHSLFYALTLIWSYSWQYLCIPFVWLLTWHVFSRDHCTYVVPWYFYNFKGIFKYYFWRLCM